MARPGWLVAGIVAVAAGLAAVVIIRWVPEVPAAAASAPVARTTLTPSQTTGSECLPRMERDAGFLDACWHANRELADADPAKDYYQLTVFGTFGPGPSGSPRWARLVADLDGEPAGNVFLSWPTGTYDGPCREEVISLPPSSNARTDTICGHTVASEPVEWTKEVTWTCRVCLLPDDDHRALSLSITVAVPEGTVPTWDIYADVGG